jgi:hypothetical protein
MAAAILQTEAKVRTFRLLPWDNCESVYVQVELVAKPPTRAFWYTAGMLDPRRDLRMFLTFLDRLNKVKVIAPRDPAGVELCVMGVVEGKEDLLDVLETVAIDHFIVCSGDILLRPTFTVYERSPKFIVQDLEKLFQIAVEIPLKILRGEQLTEDEESFTPLTSLHVCSSSVRGIEGLQRVHEWFESKKAVTTAARA